MAINLQLPSKKIWGLAVVGLIVVVGALWYHGRQVETDLLNARHAQFKDEQAARAYYNEVITRTNTVRTSVVSSYNEGDNLDTFATSDTNLSLYTKSSLKISQDESEAALRAYGASIAEILSSYSAPRENDLKVMLAALDSQKKSDLAPLKEAQTLHLKAVDQLLALSVPKSAGVIHLQLINNLAGQAMLLANMLQVFEEPLLALESAQAEYQQTADFYELVGEINLYFRGRNITFSNTEGAKIYQTI